MQHMSIEELIDIRMDAPPIFVHAVWNFSIPCLQNTIFLNISKDPLCFFNKNLLFPQFFYFILKNLMKKFDSIFLQIILYGNN
jgi:hypothetical protein